MVTALAAAENYCSRRTRLATGPENAQQLARRRHPTTTIESDAAGKLPRKLSFLMRVRASSPPLESVTRESQG